MHHLLKDTINTVDANMTTQQYYQYNMGVKKTGPHENTFS